MPPVKSAGKIRHIFVCQACGQQAPKWLGRCPACDAWSTMVEEAVVGSAATRAQTAQPANAAVLLPEVTAGDEARSDTGIAELNRVLGGGLVRGALMLVGGDPGIGKSTLLLQAMGTLVQQGRRGLYVTAEESPRQVKMRAERLGLADVPLHLLAETDLEAVESVRASLKPDVMVIDSIQTIGTSTLESAVGSVAQIRAVTHRLMHIAKGEDVAIFVVGHVTKEGTIAGPKVMEHMVDTVLYFEGERTGPYRILRAHKNRFGSAQEIGVFEMDAAGLRAVSNPSELFLSQRAVGPGAVVVTAVEGSRPILLEVQALVTPAFYGGTPRRTTTGFDPQRVAMLCAVLGARAGVELGGSDVFVNVAGGVRVSEPAADLGVVLALASAATGQAIASDTVAVGEVGLSGEVRAASQLPARLHEAAALGFARALVPRVDVERGKDLNAPLTLVPVASLAEALAACDVRPLHKH